MRWFVSVSNQSYGPMTEDQVAHLVRTQPQAMVRAETGGPWMPAYQSPFAAHAAPPSTGAVVAAAAPHPVTNVPREVWAAVGVLGGASACLYSSWVGIVVGGALVAASALSFKKNTPSPFAFLLRRPDSLLRRASGVLAGGLFLASGAGGAFAHHEATIALEKHEADSQRAVQAAAAHRHNLEGALPGNLAELDSSMSAAMARAPGDLVGGSTDLKVTCAKVDALVASMGAPTPDALGSARQKCGGFASDLDARTAAVEHAGVVDADLAAAKALAKSSKWIDAASQLDSVDANLDLIEPASPSARAALPRGFDLEARRTAAKALRTRIAAPLAQAKAKLARDEAKQKAAENEAATYRLLCGERPTRSSWDGEIVGVESALKETAHDPDSIDVSNCSVPELTSDQCWTYSCNVRGKNMLGALIFQRLSFRQTALGLEQTK